MEPVPHIPLAYLISFRAYGTWLEGDPRGSMDDDHNAFGTPNLPRNDWASTRARSLLKRTPVRFDALMRGIIERTLREVCEHRGWSMHAIAVRTEHVHIVVTAGATPEQAMNAFKAYATRRMIESGSVSRGTKVWSRHGSTEYLWTPKAVEDARIYVLDGQGPPLPME